MFIEPTRAGRAPDKNLPTRNNNPLNLKYGEATRHWVGEGYGGDVPASLPIASRPSGNEYDQLLSKSGERNEYDDLLGASDTALRGSMLEASKTTPDHHAQVLKLSNQTLLPPEIVERNFD